MKKKKDIAKRVKTPVSQEIQNKFSNQQVGRVCMKPLKHKDGTIYSDVDYFELLGRKCIELEKNNPNPNLPIDYLAMGYDRDCVELSKNIVKAIDEKIPKTQIQEYLKRCINYNE